MNSYWWWSSGAEANDSGVEIGQSLRFRGNSSLTRTFGTTSTTWTSSLWVKRGALSTNATGPQQIISFNNGLTQQRFQESDAFLLGDTAISSSLYRDPSAWYHIVCNCNGTAARAFINGEEITSLFNPAPGNRTSGGVTSIGLFSTTELDGYLADVYHIDGQALEPTAFGRENDNGVWVPREVDFTPAGMRYSDFLTATNPNPNGGTPESAFDGNLRTSATTNTNGTWTFAPDPGIAFTRLRCTTNNTAGLSSYTFDGATVNSGGQDVWVEVATNGTINAATPLVVNGTASSRAELSAIEIQQTVDGVTVTTILTNPFIWSAECFTAPNGTTTFDYTTTAKNFIAAPSSGFNGDTTAFTLAAAENSLLFRPATAITGVNQLEMFTDGNLGYVFAVNSQEVALDASTPLGTTGYKQVVLPAGFNGTLNNFGIRSTTVGGASGFGAIRINGNQVLIDGVNNSYGANGFHLTFEDPDNLGRDVANGNHFTATGFNTDPVGIWSNQIYTSTNASIDVDSTDRNFGTGAAGPAVNAFDGATNTVCHPANDGGAIVFRPDTPFENVTRIDLHYGGSVPNTVAGFNGGNEVALNTGNAWGNLYNGAAIRIENIYIRNPGMPQVTAFSINNNPPVALTNNRGADYDVMQDSPTQNYATLNPLQIFRNTVSTGALYSNANLRISQQVQATSTIGMPVDSGIYYWEGTWDSTNNSTDYMGMALQPLGAGAPPNTFYGWTWVNTNVIEWVEDGTIGASFAVPDRPVTFGWQYDSGEHTLTVFQDGTQVNQFTSLTEDTWYAVGMGLGATNGQKTFNFGQQPFLHRPAGLTDANNLQTQNLPAATIANGRDHFRVLTGPGQDNGQFYNEGNITDPQHPVVLTTPVAHGVEANGQSFVIDLGGSVTTTDVTYGTTFSNVATIWCSDDGTTWTDSGTAGATAGVAQTITIAGAEFRYVRVMWTVNPQPGVGFANSLTGVDGISILQAAQNTFDNGLWWIKDRLNNNQHQLVDSLRGNTEAITSPDRTPAVVNYVAPAGNSVAWCWNAPDTFTPTVTGGLTNTAGRSNAAAGFSIVEWTGSSTDGATITHGLGDTPDFIIWTSTTFADMGRPVWHVGLDNSGFADAAGLFINNNFGSQNMGGGFITPGATTLTLETGGGGDDNVNDAGDDYIAYCWRSIPGYSAFGSYIGINNANGPVIVTGFRPAFVLIKLATANGGSWSLHDNARDIDNPANIDIFPNSAGGEGLNSFTQIDILSNGFKIRGESGTTGQLNATLIYACFAENPAGSSNTSPANAR